MDEIDKYLSSVYFDPKRSGGFAGVERLYRDVKEEGMYKLTRKQILEWLMVQDAFTLHKPVRRNFKRNCVLVSGIDEQWQLDLADMQSLKVYNDGYIDICLCVLMCFLSMHGCFLLRRKLVLF